MAPLLIMIAMMAGGVLILLIVVDPKLRNLLTPGLGDGMAGPRPAPEDPSPSPPRDPEPRSIIPIMDLTDLTSPGLGRGPVCPACRSNLIVGMPVFRASLAEFNRELPELERAADSGPELLDWIRRQNDRDPGRDPHVSVEFRLCHTCQTGWLVIQSMVPTWAGFEGDPSQEQIVTLPPSVTEALTR